MRIRGLIACLCLAVSVLAAPGAVVAKKTGEESFLPEGHEIVATFEHWEARTFPLKDGSTACAADSLSLVERKDEEPQWLSVVWGAGETTGYLYYAPGSELGAQDKVTYLIAGTNYVGYVQDGAAYLHTEDNLAVLRHLANGSPLSIEVSGAGNRAYRLSYAPQGFVETYQKIGQICGFSTAEVIGGDDEWRYAHSGQYGAWAVATWKSAAGVLVCDAESTEKSDPEGRPDLFLSYKNEKSPYGYLVYAPQKTPLKAADRVAAAVGGQVFSMFVDQGRAFPYEEDDAALIRALASAPALEIQVASEGGEIGTRRFVLDGFVEAYRQIGKLCDFSTDWLGQPDDPTESADSGVTTVTLETDQHTAVVPVAITTPAIAPAQVTPEMRNEPRFALLIGNADYGDRYGLSTLRAPGNDVTVMGETLGQLGFSVTTLVNADLDEMNEAVDAFGRKIRNGGVGLFFFSGHGMQMSERNFLFPIGSRMERPEDVHTQTFPVETILNVMQNAGNRLNIVILDACRSNPFSGGSRTRAQGLAAVSAPEESQLVIAYAAAAGRNAYEPVEPGFTLGHYTSALVDALKIPGLEMEYVFRQARAATRQRTEGDQIPWTSSSVEDVFYFHLP